VDSVTALLVRDPSGVERLVTLGARAVTIGREVGCDVRLESQYVSQRHARIEQQTAGAVLVDLDSLNGCFVNERRIRNAVPISAGDVIGIADVSIRCLARLTIAPATQRYDRRLIHPAPPPAETLIAGGHEGTGAAPASTARGRRHPADALRVLTRTHEVWLGQSPPVKRLSAQEFKLLEYLYDHRDRVCTRQELGDGIWTADNWDLNMLYRLIHRLKDKIEPEGAGAEKPRYVQTVPQIGYRLTP
jgi:hypothetical protein